MPTLHLFDGITRSLGFDRHCQDCVRCGLTLPAPRPGLVGWVEVDDSGTPRPGQLRYGPTKRCEIKVKVTAERPGPPGAGLAGSPIPLRLVLVEWVDSFGCSDTWKLLESAPPSELLCRSVGWLLHDGADCKTVVPHVANPLGDVGRQGCGDMTIPVTAIRRLVDLAVP